MFISEVLRATRRGELLCEPEARRALYPGGQGDEGLWELDGGGGAHLRGEDPQRHTAYGGPRLLHVAGKLRIEAFITV